MIKNAKTVGRERIFMAEKKKSGIAARVAELVKDTVEECGVSLWDVEFGDLH